MNGDPGHFDRASEIADYVGAAIAFLLIGAFAYMQITSIPISDGFLGIVTVIVGFFFGRGTMAAGRRISRPRGGEPQ